MKRPLLRVLTATAALALASPALATNGMRLNGFGAVQDAMGGVGVGATLDTSAILSNPAGITELGRRLDVSLSWFQPSVEHKATGVAPGFVLADGATVTSDRGGSPIPAVGFVMPLGGGFSAGIGAFGVAGLGADFKPNLYSSKALTSYMQLRVAPAIAWKMGDVFSVGLALNAMWASMEYDVASAFGQVPHDAASSLGYGATLGVKFTPVKGLTFGVAYETKSDFQDFEFDIAPRTLPPTLPPPFGGAPVPGGTDKLAFDQPAVASVGVAWQPGPELLLGLDVQWINWSDVMGKNLPKYTNDTQFTAAMPFDMDWSDQVVVKLGAQYLVMPALAVRLGYDYGKNPLNPDRAFENIVFPAVAEHHITAGLGWSATDALAINLAVMYSPTTSLEGANPELPAMLTGGATNGQGIQSYQSSMSQLALDVGVSWKF